jgi:hypothetical protein
MVKTPRKKTGGRTKESPARARDKAAEVARSGVTPLDFLLKVMRNPKEPMWLRCQCAKAAAPFVHPKLAQIDHSIGGRTFVVIKGGLPDGDDSVLDLRAGPGEEFDPE